MTSFRRAGLRETDGVLSGELTMTCGLISVVRNTLRITVRNIRTELRSAM
jgi:hypothetical protein